MLHAVVQRKLTLLIVPSSAAGLQGQSFPRDVTGNTPRLLILLCDCCWGAVSSLRVRAALLPGMLLPQRSQPLAAAGGWDVSRLHCGLGCGCSNVSIG